MTVRKPIIMDDTATLEKLQGGDILDPTCVIPSQQGFDCTAQNAVNICNCVREYSSGQIGLARADSLADSLVLGLALTTVGTSSPVKIITGGAFTATGPQWAASSNESSSGLVAGNMYYLDPVSAGKITRTKPTTSGQTVTPIGISLSNTILIVRIGTISLIP